MCTPIYKIIIHTETVIDMEENKQFNEHENKQFNEHELDDFYKKKESICRLHQEFIDFRVNNLVSDFIKYIKGVPQYEGIIMFRIFDTFENKYYPEIIYYTDNISNAFKKILEDMFEGNLIIDTFYEEGRTTYPTIKYSLKENATISVGSVNSNSKKLEKFYKKKEYIRMFSQELSNNNDESKIDNLVLNFIKYLRRIPLYTGFARIKEFDITGNMHYDESIFDSFKKILEEKFNGNLEIIIDEMSPISSTQVTYNLKEMMQIQNNTEISMTEKELEKFYNKKERSALKYKKMIDSQANIVATNFINFLQAIPEYKGSIFVQQIDPDNFFRGGYRSEVIGAFQKILKEKFHGILLILDLLTDCHGNFINFELARIKN